MTQENIQQEVIDVPQKKQNEKASNTETETIQTSIANINMSREITETSDFQQVLQTIPLRVKEANELLESYRADKDAFIENLDEENLDEQLAKMQDVNKFAKNIIESRKEIKKYLDGIRDNVLSELDERLQNADFNLLEQAQDDIKQLKKDVITDRYNKRWKELEETFKANIDRYALIREYTPELADISRFKILNPKLVSGAKTRKIKEKDHTYINETLYNWNTALEVIIENGWGLSANDLHQLVTLFKQNPSMETVTNEGRQLKVNADERERQAKEAEQRRLEAEKKAQAEAERRRIEMERINEQARLAKLAQDQKAQAQAEQQRKELEQRAEQARIQEQQRREQLINFGGQYKTIFKESFPMFIEYMFNNAAYHNVHHSAKTKAGVIYDIMHQVDNPNSVVARETGNNPQKVLDLVRYILDA